LDKYKVRTRLLEGDKQNMTVKVERALLKVAAKKGVVELGQGLEKLGIELLATHGTARVLRQAGVSVQPVSQVTGFPETLDGRIKTLHPAIHVAIQARQTPRHQRQLQDLSLAPIGLVVVNLMPFEEIIQLPNIKPEEALEKVDVGGGALLRAAAKNYEAVAVVCDPGDYSTVLRALRRRRAVPYAMRAWLALKAFRLSACCDVLVAEYLTQALSPMLKAAKLELPR
jgi:phosphoribosylaminoimidazolecarboxamide formyltransferase/IMP cyclohydrolase